MQNSSTYGIETYRESTMFLTRNTWGVCLEWYNRHTDCHYKQQYQGYSMAEAKKRFRAYIDAQIANDPMMYLMGLV